MVRVFDQAWNKNGLREADAIAGDDACLLCRPKVVETTPAKSSRHDSFCQRSSECSANGEEVHSEMNNDHAFNFLVDCS